MRIDKIDIKIILALLLFEDFKWTTTSLTKLIYDGIRDRRDLQNLDSNIRKRLKKLVKYGILTEKDVNINGNVVKIYSLNKDSIFIGFKSSDSKIEIHTII